MDIIRETEQWVKNQLLHETTGHDWCHIVRVTRVAEGIGKKEGADLFIVKMAALLHDLADDKVNKNEHEAITTIVRCLESLHVAPSSVKHILEIIQTISFKGGNGEKVRTLEAEVVQDADRLDAIGAIGIARTFQYSGANGQPIYDPDISTRENISFEEYRNGKTSGINHFYEKLLLLKDKMNTATGKRLAEKRHAIMEQFLEEFYKEWQCEIDL